MEIKVYDEVDPLDVLALNMVSLGFPLTPETASLIRKLDERPFPFFALYAVEDGLAVGQVGVFRLPVMTTGGPSDVGGVWAVSTQPAYGRRGISSTLMEEAHARMRTAGLRFSTLGTNRSLAAHRMYRKLGYVDVHIATVSLSRSKDVSIATALEVEKANDKSIAAADEFFDRTAADRLGFANRQPNFLQMMSKTGELDGKLHLIQDQNKLVGYAVCRLVDKVLYIVDLLLQPSIEPRQAISALIYEFDQPYVRVRCEDPHMAESLAQAGFPSPLAEYGSFMIKALYPEDTVDEAVRSLGIGTSRFLISPLDTT